MAIGLGVVLILAGLILLSNAVTLNLSHVNDTSLGWVLLLVGVLAIVISLVVNEQRSRRTVVQERREFHDEPRI
ncbi:MAG: hypothetical protein JWP74_256 [Marmoricola sp.]|nr:hypothetical protein [Marmoricola sp.]